MKRKELLTIREKTVENLNKEVFDLRSKIDKAKMDMKIAKEKNLKKVKNLARNLSQVLTIIREKEISGKGEKS